ncbi:MAG TPA: Rieske (2Fe-2S) protein [Blastocatellia bacterium]|nr:Rieske (2Fe-2S) protein [Blastocatellia bacterium]
MPEQPTTGTGAEQPAQPERRSFFNRLFKTVLGLWGAAFAGVVISYIKSPGEMRSAEEKVKRVGPVTELEIGSARFVAHEREPFWVIRTARDELVALPATCTHLRCILQWDKESGRLVCPCHAGAFDLNGNVVAGPPPRPLQSLRVDTRGGVIYVNLS